MLVDNSVQQQPLQQQPYSFNTMSTSFDDYLNMDLFAGPSSNSGSSRSSSPRSPTNSFHSLLTPPQSSLPSSFPALAQTSDHDSFFNFALDDDYSKVDNLFNPSSTTPFDFLGTFNRISSSPDTSAPSPTLAIDPQLVGTPATSKALSDFDEEEEEQDADEDEEDATAVAPVKVAGHGKLRKGTVQSGGVVKKSAGASGVREKDAAAAKKGKEDRDDLADDWRPSPEEYKKMSSKEKRQLRNKISARNFRVRRKEYINTLEGDIAERDRILDAIRTELGSTQSENVALRQEIAALKKALLGGRDTPVLPPPGPIPTSTPVPALITSPTPAPTQLLTPNTHKDLPTSTRINSARGFWGGALGGMGGITPVHTALMPEWSTLVRKPVSALQENINPSLNATPTQPTKSVQPLGPGFEAFADGTPFTLKALDAYRMQLWGKMAMQHQYQQQLQKEKEKEQSPANTHVLTPLAQGLKPLFFAASTRQNLGPLNGGSGKPGPAKQLPLSSPLHASKHMAAPTKGEREAMYVAALASQTLLQRLGSAFWDAFSGGGPSGAAAAAASGAGRAWDADKVRRVLEGKAVVRVVDVDSVGAGKVAAGVQTQSQSASGQCRGESCVYDILEEGMRSLSIAKKSA